MARRRHRGITLLEVLFVVLILGLVAAAAIPRFVYSGETRVDECRANAALLNAKIDMHFARTGGRSPANAEEFRRLVSGDREDFPAGLPKCPYGRPYEYDPATGHIIMHKH